MKICNHYTQQSTICNDKLQGVCPMHQIQDINHAIDPTDPTHQRILEFRCPRQPFIGKEPHYVKHI